MSPMALRAEGAGEALCQGPYVKNLQSLTHMVQVDWHLSAAHDKTAMFACLL